VDRKYYWGLYKKKNIDYIHFRDIMSFIVYPAKDFLIAMGFTGIYFYQEKSDQLQKKKLNDISRLGLPRRITKINEDSKSNVSSGNYYLTSG
jgi:hypothetical protein